MSLKEKIRIMVVDDMTVSRGLLTMGLEKIGIKNVVPVDHAQKALKALETTPVHLILSDYNMPDMDGLDFLLALRKNQKTQRIGFIMVSGSFNQTIVDLGKRLGMNNFLKKPFNEQSLKQCVESVTGAL
ncbi:MAG: response regulator [Pseudomonadota bacterium]